MIQFKLTAHIKTVGVGGIQIICSLDCLFITFIKLNTSTEFIWCIVKSWLPQYIPNNQPFFGKLEWTNIVLFSPVIGIIPGYL